MTDMPETIWAAIHPHGSMECIDYPVSYTTEYRRADLPPSREQVEAMVKPLEWTEHGPFELRANDQYEIDIDFDEHGPVYRLYKGLSAVSLIDAGCEDDAKRVADEDHTRRILAALGYEVSND